MVFDVSIALAWLLFLALFPISFYWLRRVWVILVRKDLSEVALKRGEPPPNPAKYAPWTVALNLVAAAVLIYVIFGVVFAFLTYEAWSAIAGSTIWLKIILDFAISRHAHFVVKKRGS